MTIAFSELYPKLDQLHVALQRIKEAHTEENLLERTQEEIDAVADILSSVIELENFLIDVNARLEETIKEIELENSQLKKKYKADAIKEIKEKVYNLLDQTQKLSKVLRKEEKQEEKEIKKV